MSTCPGCGQPHDTARCATDGAWACSCCGDIARAEDATA